MTVGAEGTSPISSGHPAIFNNIRTELPFGLIRAVLDTELRSYFAMDDVELEIVARQKETDSESLAKWGNAITKFADIDESLGVHGIDLGELEELQIASGDPDPCLSTGAAAILSRRIEPVCDDLVSDGHDFDQLHGVRPEPLAS